MRLAGRRILITGAASGIGRATAFLFRSEGASLGLLDCDAAALAQTHHELEKTAGRGELFDAVADVSDGAAVKRGVEACGQALGGLDGIVASAGIDLVKPFAEMDSLDWEKMMAVNLSGPFHVCKAALPFLKEAGESTIVHIASGAALRPLEARTAYCAAKAGLVMFAKALAIDLAPYNVRVNTICPGIVDTPLFRRSIEAAEDPEAELARVFERYLIKRAGQPKDIANAALFLSSVESAHITGAALAVDGGRTFH